MFEKAAYGQFYEYFYAVLFSYHSTNLAKLELVERIREEIDQIKMPLSVFLDMY